MTNLIDKYAESIAAGRALEGGVWGLALALAKNVSEGGGTATEATKALAEAGVTSTSGEPYSPKRVQELVQVGTFAGAREGAGFPDYRLERVKEAGIKHEWDAEAMLLTLQAGETSNEIRGRTTIFGSLSRESVRKEIDRLPAKDKAALATELVAQTEVREAILQSGPMAIEQHLDLTTEVVRTATENSERTMKTEFPSHAARTAADEVGTAVRHLNNALAEVIQWKVTEEDDRLRLLDSALVRAERACAEIRDCITVPV